MSDGKETPGPAGSLTDAARHGGGRNAPITTTRPYIGILGVFLGAATATLYSRLVGVGLPDLRGAIGAGFDEASWIPTVLSMGTMFIGPFSVFLASVFGPRRVLLYSGVVFTITCFLLPFSPSLSAMLALQLIAGLSSGSFYPLTLTFVARSLPPRLIIFGIAAYALDIVVTSNTATLIQGWCAEYLSWRWIFWTPAALTPLVMVCVYLGVPRAPKPTSESRHLNWRGFTYMSAGLALICGALDQGERLDWLNSGVIVGLLIAGVFLISAAVIRRWMTPNPMIDLPFLNARNIAILGTGIILFRFIHLASIVLIPSFLGNLREYRNLEVGYTLAWLAAPELVFVWVVAVVVLFIHARYVLAGGFALVAIASWLCGHLDSNWAGRSFIYPELLLSLGIATAYVGLVASLVLLALEMGALQSPSKASTFSSCMHVARIFGGQVGVAVLTRFLTVREQFHSNILGLNVQAGNWITDERVTQLTGAFSPYGSGPDEAQARAIGLLNLQVRAQAFTRASADGFTLITWSAICFLLTLILLRSAKLGFGDLRRMQ
jgi:DHA2 family multidrug resistance protein